MRRQKRGRGEAAPLRRRGSAAEEERQQVRLRAAQRKRLCAWGQKP